MNNEELISQSQFGNKSCTCEKIYTNRKLVAPDCIACNYRDEVIELMNAARKDEAIWHPMEEAPKDGWVLIVDKRGIIRIGGWGSFQERWFFGDYYIIHNPIAWTHLPVYNPENKPK